MLLKHHDGKSISKVQFCAAFVLVFMSAVVSYHLFALYVSSTVQAKAPSVEAQNPSSSLDSPKETKKSESQSQDHAHKTNTENPSQYGALTRSHTSSSRQVGSPSSTPDAITVNPERSITSSSLTFHTASQFRANGCRAIGTVNMSYQGRMLSWRDYVQQSEGSQGECVTAIQQKLNTYCKNKIAVDGIFGPQTAGAVRSLQAYVHSFGDVTAGGANIYIDGIVGPQTFAILQAFTASAPFLDC